MPTDLHVHNAPTMIVRTLDLPCMTCVSLAYKPVALISSRFANLTDTTDNYNRLEHNYKVIICIFAIMIMVVWLMQGNQRFPDALVFQTSAQFIIVFPSHILSRGWKRWNLCSHTIGLLFIITPFVDARVLCGTVVFRCWEYRVSALLSDDERTHTGNWTETEVPGSTAFNVQTYSRICKTHAAHKFLMIPWATVFESPCKNFTQRRRTGTWPSYTCCGWR